MKRFKLHEDIAEFLDSMVDMLIEIPKAGSLNQLAITKNDKR